MGDFILTNDICIERKGISDLFQSFASGRLYNQVENMFKYYTYACLLIEFSADRPFALQASGDIGATIGLNSISSRICLLTMAFPKLKVLWSRSQHATVNMFYALKSMYTRGGGRDGTGTGTGGMDLETIKKVGSNTRYEDPDDGDGTAGGFGMGSTASNTNTTTSNTTPHSTMPIDILHSLPGLNTSNYHLITDTVDCIADLCCMGEMQLTGLIGCSNAKLLVGFFNQEMVME